MRSATEGRWLDCQTLNPKNDPPYIPATPEQEAAYVQRLNQSMMRRPQELERVIRSALLLRNPNAFSNSDGMHHTNWLSSVSRDDLVRWIGSMIGDSYSFMDQARREIDASIRCYAEDIARGAK